MRRVIVVGAGVIGLSCAVRLLDLGFFRIGGEQYAAENSSYGLATLLKEHVSVNRAGEITLEFPGKSGKLWQRTLAEPEVCEVVAALEKTRLIERFPIARGAA